MPSLFTGVSDMVQQKKLQPILNLLDQDMMQQPKKKWEKGYGIALKSIDLDKVIDFAEEELKNKRTSTASV